MRVIVGKRGMPTPLMAGLIRYATLNPYWNLPPDLIRERARERRSRRDRRRAAAGAVRLVGRARACSIRARSTGARSRPAAACVNLRQPPGRTT